MKASQINSLLIANFLESHPLIDKIIYPGLKKYKYYDLYKSQYRGPGTIMSIYLKGDINNVKLFLENLKIFSLAVSLGAVESLICSPSLMTHAIVPRDIREELGITDNLLRISVGIEDSNDLINDLSQALDYCNK
jgi:cystathionine gamma-lyase